MEQTQIQAQQNQQSSNSTPTTAIEQQQEKMFWYPFNDLSGTPPSNRNCHSSTNYGQYLIIFGGREGDGKKRIVNDIFILNTGRFNKQCPELQQWSKVDFSKSQKAEGNQDEHIAPQINDETQPSPRDGSQPPNPQLQNNVITEPPPRMGHTAQLYDGKIIIYGGWNGFKVLNDTVFLDLKKGVENMTCWAPKVNGEPPARQFHTASIIGDKMYVFGGGDGKYWLNDLLIFDLRTHSWEDQVETLGRPPAGRLQHAAIVYDDKIFIFGGEPDRYRQLNDLFFLDTSNMTWYCPQASGVPPSPRVSTTGCLVGSKIYFFGGYDGMNWLNDVHILDLEKISWENVKCGGNKPKARCRHSANLVKGQIYIFGGNDCDISYNDVYVLPTGVHVPESSLLSDFLKILHQGLFSDVTFVVEDVRIPAHRNILAARCDLFAKMFTAGMRETTEQVITIQDISASTFKSMLEYVYTDFIELTPELATQLLIASDRYDLSRLKGLCEKFLFKVIDLDNVIDLLCLSNKHQAQELKRVCMDFAVMHFDIITKKNDLQKLSKPLILELLQKK